MHLYIGSERQLPIIPWRWDAPAFHVVSLPRRADPVRRKFQCPLVYYAGGHERCGCSFNVGRAFSEHHRPPSDVQHRLGGLMAARRDINDLGDYLRRNPVFQIYHCWDGMEPEPMACRTRATVDLIESNGFHFKDRELVNIIADADQASLARSPGYPVFHGAWSRARAGGQE
jgi:hypothetical protein